MLTARDILTNILVTADYPEVKREGFMRTFYEYLMVKVLKEVEQDDPQLYQKLMGCFADETATDREIQEGLQEAYGNPQLKEKMDKVVEQVIGELVSDVSKYSNEEQKKRITQALNEPQN